MKRYLLSEKGNFYKANLHCHSTFSDGRNTPEEIKKHYVENGYSVIAFTDHNIFVSHEYLNDDSFLALNGVEINIDEAKEWKDSPKTCHICLIALNQTIEAHPLWDEKMEVDKSKTTYKMVYNPECVSKIMGIGADKGFFVTYNHPRWSLENYEQYIKYENMNAMEIYNHGCIELGYFEYNGAVYDEMLRAGKKIYAIATDDNHQNNQACGGYVMINAEKLEYKAITKALQEGRFYSSTGPAINALWYDDENKEIHIETSKAKQIICSTGIRRQLRIRKNCRVTVLINMNTCKVKVICAVHTCLRRHICNNIRHIQLVKVLFSILGNSFTIGNNRYCNKFGKIININTQNIIGCQIAGCFNIHRLF